MNKLTFHVPVEQYGFLEAEVEVQRDISWEESAAIYTAIGNAFKPKPINSLPEKEWRKFLERVLLGEPNHINEFEQCSPDQKRTINEIKKTLARIEAREPKPLRDRENE